MPRRLPILLLSFALAASAQAPTPNSVEKLAGIQQFAFGGVGFAGTTSEGELEFRKIAAKPHANAIADFEKLYSIGNPQGKSYALAGLRLLDRNKFNQAVTSLSSANTKVSVMSGCIVHEQTLKALALNLGAGQYDPWLSKLQAFPR